MNKGTLLPKGPESLAIYEHILQILASKPGSSSREATHAWNNRGLVLRHMGRVEEAITSYDRAVECDPGNFEAWDNRGYALTQLGRLTEALTSIEKSLQVNPQHANGIYNKGYCYALMGRTREAIDCIAEAIRLNPQKYGPAARTDPDLERLRKNKRFQALLAGLDLPSSGR